MVDIRILEQVIVDQMNEINNRSITNLCMRYEEQLIDLNSSQAQVVIGVRRSGKSTLCLQRLKRAGVRFGYVNFDDERLYKVENDDLNPILEVLYKIYGDINYLFFDEIQNVNGWHLFVNRLLRNQFHVIITGSNAKLLSSELATHLTGRCKEIALLPFSFSDYCNFHKIDTQNRSTKDIAIRRAAFDNYLRKGGFPEIGHISDSKEYVGGLVTNIIQRDIIERHNVKFKKSFVELTNHLLNIVPTMPSSTDLASLFQYKSPQTVKNQIGFLQQAYLFTGIQQYNTKSRQRITSEKIYPIDVALMNQRNNAFANENLGWRLETIVFLQLLRNCKMRGEDIYYLRERSNECDFICCHGNNAVRAIQVSYDISNPRTRERELNGLVLAHQRTQCPELLLLTDHEYNDITHKGLSIAIRPVHSWTLESVG